MIYEICNRPEECSVDVFFYKFIQKYESKGPIVR